MRSGSRMFHVQLACLSHVNIAKMVSGELDETMHDTEFVIRARRKWVELYARLRTPRSSADAAASVLRPCVNRKRRHSVKKSLHATMLRFKTIERATMLSINRHNA